MPKKQYNAEEIIHKLPGTDVLLGQGKTVSQACKQIGVSDQTYYRWRLPRSGTRYALCASRAKLGREPCDSAGRDPHVGKGAQG
jgi:hypothetical protein